MLSVVGGCKERWGDKGSVLVFLMVELDGEGERERKWNWRHERGTRGS
jgi:hypothetical protein